MFGKFLVTVAVIAIVWFGFKYLQRLAELDDRRRARRRMAPPARPSAAPSDPVQDLVKCPACGNWQASGQVRRCGRSNCPY